MKIKYNRVSTLNQSGNRFQEDDNTYDLVLMDKVSGKTPFFERENGRKIKELVEKGKVSLLVCEDYSRMGRNTGDLISTLEYLEEHKVNVFVRNIGLYSRPNGERNPIWKMFSSVMSSIYELELENIRERTFVVVLVLKTRSPVTGQTPPLAKVPASIAILSQFISILQHWK